MRTKEMYVPHTSSRTASAVKRLLQLYPDDPALGSPFLQPPIKKQRILHPAHQAIPIPPAVDAPRMFPPAYTNQFRRAAAIVGDLVFESGRRALLNAVVGAGASSRDDVKAWGYHFRQMMDDTPTHLGVWHTTETSYGMYATSNRVARS